ncbi:MAG: ABC transporter ATP-binding protein [Candidatus Woesearchaeota archaeon]
MTKIESNNIEITNIKKTFNLTYQNNQSILARLLSVLSAKQQTKKIEVIKKISFNVKKGEIVGLIGKNGSGKSTLLRLIAGIYPLDSGTININGKIISIIGLGQGMKERLTMKENIFLACSLFGISRKNIKKKLNSIINFAELKEYTNTKLFQFSSGMIQRLAFSIAIHSDPDILLLDEVFEVGDKEFRKKSSEKLKELVKQGKSIILVSHEIWMIEKHCNRVIWLKDGKIYQEGETKEILKNY